MWTIFEHSCKSPFPDLIKDKGHSEKACWLLLYAHHPHPLRQWHSHTHGMLKQMPPQEGGPTSAYGLTCMAVFDIAAILIVCQVHIIFLSELSSVGGPNKLPYDQRTTRQRRSWEGENARKSYVQRDQFLANVLLAWGLLLNLSVGVECFCPQFQILHCIPCMVQVLQSQNQCLLYTFGLPFRSARAICPLVQPVSLTWGVVPVSSWLTRGRRSVWCIRTPCDISGRQAGVATVKVQEKEK